MRLRVGTSLISWSILLLWAADAIGAEPASAPVPNNRGTVTTVDAPRGIAQVEVAGSRYEVRLADLTPASRSALMAAVGTGKEVDFAPPQALILVGDDTGITNTGCRESKIASPAILSTAAQASSQDEFLLALGDALPQATFVYESRSLQQDRVDRMNPRVIRFSFDGKQVISYVCDPRSRDYGTIEVMTWNEESSQYDFAHISFQGKAKRKPGHIETNPESCTACHGSGDAAKPIWGNYPDWPGAYGAKEDLLGDPGSQDYASFQKFKKRYRDSPCLSTLPWPKEGSKAAIYPFVERPFDLNFSMRPNTRLTGRLSTNYSEALYKRISKDPLWPVMRFYVFADYLECGSTYPWSGNEKSVNDRAARWLPALSEAASGDLGAPAGVELLTRYAMVRGIPPDAWNLDLPASAEGKPNLKYNTGRGSMQRMIVGRAMGDALDEPGSGMQQVFAPVKRPYFREGPVLGCEEASPDANEVFSRTRDEACAAVMAKLDELDRMKPEDCPMPDEHLPVKQNDPAVQLAAVLAKDAQEGRMILENQCSACHSGSGSLGFLSSDEALRKHLNGSGRFSGSSVIGAIRSGEMPMDEDPLSAAQLKKVSAYIETLMVK